MTWGLSDFAASGRKWEARPKFFGHLKPHQRPQIPSLQNSCKASLQPSEGQRSPELRMLPKIPPACAVLGLRSPNPPKSSRKNNLHSLKPFAAPASDPNLGGLKKPISVRLVWMLEVYLQKGRQVVTVPLPCRPAT